MKKLFTWIINLLFPGIIFLMLGRMLFMIIAFLLQATIIGWIPAIIWARAVWNKDMKEEEPQKPALSKKGETVKKSPHSLAHSKKTPSPPKTKAQG